MTLETVYYIGQTVAVLAILLSLVGIWLQMRQSQQIARADLSNQLRLAYQNLTFRMVDDPELVHGFRVLVIERGRLDDDITLGRMMGWFGAYANLYNDAVDATRKGLLDDWLFEEIESAWVQYLTVPVVWKNAQNILAQRRSSEATNAIIEHWTTLRERALEEQRNKSDQHENESQTKATS